MRIFSMVTGKLRSARVLLILPFALAVASTATAAVLDVPWSGGGTGTTTVVSDGTSGPATFTYSVRGSFFGASGNWNFNTVASSTRTVVLKYTYTGFHAWFRVTVGLQAFVGTTTYPLVNNGPVNCCTPPSGGFTYTGTVTLPVQAGDTYGFRMSGSNFDSNPVLQGTLEVDENIIDVSIDIHPGSFPNAINPRSQGVIPVAILTTPDFDATTVDPASVQFGPNHATEVHGDQAHIEDVDGDGDLDLVFHFDTQATGIQCGDTSASLTGKTVDGLTIQGSDTIRTVGCR